MNGEERRKAIMEELARAAQPVSGTLLASRLHVSRQVIVQDIALLRAENKNIISTNKGYMLYKSEENRLRARRTVKVSHDTDQVLEEFYTVVDLGGLVLNVFIEHELYGQLEADLCISSRADAEDFAERMASCKDKPLKFLTDEVHYHTLEAKNEEVLDRIVRKLDEKGFLV
jgi:hypothetical protein